MALSPVSKKVGSAATGPLAIILSPIMPKWDDGKFCAPLVEQLTAKGYQTHIYDSLSLATDTSLDDTAAAWNQFLQQQHTHIQLAIGHAYGGALVHSLLSGALATCPMVIGISAPTHSNAILRIGLKNILTQLSQYGETAAIAALAYWIQAKNNPTSTLTRSLAIPSSIKQENGTPHVTPGSTSIQRLRIGLSQLLDFDARPAVEKYVNRLLILYGTASRLVNHHSITLSHTNAQQMCIGLAASGMRPLIDNPTLTLKLIAHFLHSPNANDKMTSITK